MKITILQGAFLPVPALRGGAIEKAWEALGQAFAKQGHEVTHVSRLCDGLPPREKIGEVDIFASGVRMRFQGRGCSNYWRCLICFRPGGFFPRRTYWLPMLSGPAFSSQGSFRQTLFARRTLSQGQMKLYKKASRFQVPSHAVAKAVIREIPNRENLVSVLPYPLGWSVPESKPAHERPKRILYAGRLHPEKGFGADRGFRGHCKEGGKGMGFADHGSVAGRPGGGGQGYLRSINDLASKYGSCVEILEPVFNQGIVGALPASPRLCLSLLGSKR